ncbi:MAG: hypothetical protein O2951_13710 [Bacteroidetes bacterium]|nr:hypothetical protein [Bacteroidota bacterium]
MKTVIVIFTFLYLSTSLKSQSIDKGEINKADFNIEIPEKWKGGLVMYAHGYEETDEYAEGAEEEEENEEEEEDEGQRFFRHLYRKGLCVCFLVIPEQGPSD